MIELISNVRVVLVNTTHPGNIGATARAMKTMGLSELVLVEPLLFPHEEADARATSAIDVLQHARVVPTLREAIADCGLVLGTSAQSRHMPWPMLSPREIGPLVHEMRATQPVALVFGRERDGLSNEELQLCHYHVQIPTHASCRCLNIAQAVQVLCYEVMMSGALDCFVGSTLLAMTKSPYIPRNDEAPLATPADMDRFYEHLERALIHTQFLDPEHPKMLIPRLKRLFTKARPDQNEMNILRGILTSMERDAPGRG
jgi:tRNA (cytidine32/uridine32-2'-O)-methyltransferase